MLLRTGCKIYNEMSYQLSHKSKTKLMKSHSESPQVTQLLPSPSMPVKTKLSPLAMFQENSPEKSPMRTNRCGSVLQCLGINSIFKGQKCGPLETSQKPKRVVDMDTTASGSLSPFAAADHALPDEFPGPDISSVPIDLQQNGTSAEEAKRGLLFCVCGSLCEAGNTQCATCLANSTPVVHSGFLYEKLGNDKVATRFWYRLLGRSLYRIVHLALMLCHIRIH